MLLLVAINIIECKGVIKMIESEKYLLNANDVVDLLGVKRPTAYKIIRDANIRLAKAGKLTIRGKINRRYLLKMLDVSEV